jgi:Ca-activated chloride channel family protein
MQAALSTAPLPVPPPSSGVRLVASDGRELAFRGATVHVRAQGGLAVVVLTQRFVNPHAEPLSVRYTMPLPADAAVRGYSFLLAGRLIRGEVDRKNRARERFEEAIASGRTAGLVDQERSSVFTQELGNIPPGEEIVAMLELDQKLEWLNDGQWSWRFPTVVGPRYLGAAGRVPDADKVTVELPEAPRAVSPRVELVLHVLDALEGDPSSPTHPLAIARSEGTEIRLAQEALLDRDIAVRWPVAQPRVGLSLQIARPEARSPISRSGYGLLTVVPPTPSARPRPLPRDLIFLLDASGSMYGAPMQQAKSLMRSLLQTLEDTDQLELISFGDRPHRWKRGATRATPDAKQEALAWIDRLQAEGGTEMRSGILEALQPLRPGAQRQVILITDGLIGFESEIVATLREKLPPGCRLHTVGVGSSVNRSLTGPAARAGHGVEVIVDLDGDVAEATRALLARTCAPLVTDLVLEGDALEEHAPAKLPDLFAGAPALLSLRLKAGGGVLRLRGTTSAGPWSEEVLVPAQEPGEGSPSLAALFARERVEDLETLRAMGRDVHRLDQEIEQTGLDFQIATRLTSWVAVTEERTVDPEAKKRKESVLQELPYGMNAEALGLRTPARLAAEMVTDAEEGPVP